VFWLEQCSRDRDIRSVLVYICEAETVVRRGTVLTKKLHISRIVKRIKCIGILSVYSEIKGNCSNTMKYKAVELITVYL
jgi:hypothetical protein